MLKYGQVFNGFQGSFSLESGNRDEGQIMEMLGDEMNRGFLSYSRGSKGFGPALVKGFGMLQWIDSREGAQETTVFTPKTMGFP